MAGSNTPELKLNQGDFQALFTLDGLNSLDNAFLGQLKAENLELSNQLAQYRDHKITAPIEISNFIIELAPHLEKFIINLFNIQTAAENLQAEILSQDPIFQFKKYYVLMQAKRNFEKYSDDNNFSEINKLIEAQLIAPQNSHDKELLMATYGCELLKNPEENKDKIDELIKWCVLALKTPEGKCFTKNWSSFHLPQKKHFENLVPIIPVPNDLYGRLETPPELHRARDGFKLTDPRKSEREVLDEIHYCVYCHKTDGDFCSKGFPVKKNNPELGFKTDPTGELLTGCPLEEKISEMHVLKKNGFSIGALAIIMIDNPMCAATGHRICNDCMKGCIYQKQDPVNIPEVETRVLTDVLHLPWGVEIYDLLMRWNPLRQFQYVQKEFNHQKILVMGMGPAGFTLAHHLLMEGCAVVGCDGLKIEPLNPTLLNHPIYDFKSLQEDLDERIITGFGGVAEYGITVRWDKNFLKLIYISLARRQHFQVFGGVRFGGTITVENAWKLGFDHLAIAVGAGLPRELKINNSLAPGMRQANDFLMALQLTGAIKKNSLANLQVRLPAVVIGGGLTGIDTATEVQAYYIIQAEKTHQRYHILKNTLGEEKLRQQFDAQSLEVIDEFLNHAEIILAERKNAKLENRNPNFQQLIREWGGVTIAYRKSMQESPAYKRNHEEMTKALEEGIYYAEHLEPQSAILDDFGSVQAVIFSDGVSHEEKTLPAKSIFVATGASPNVAYEFEHEGTFKRHKFEYDSYTLNFQNPSASEGELIPANNHLNIKDKNIGVFTSYQHNNHFVSFIGDTNPVFHGSVVKAIASAKKSYPDIMKSLEALTPTLSRLREREPYSLFRHKINNLFQSVVISNKKINNYFIELIIHSPLAAKCFKPGQFYRIQNYAFNSSFQTEAVAALGILNQNNADQLIFYIHQNGASTKLISMFKENQAIALMGPTGAKAKIPKEPESILIMGDQLSIAYLLSVAPALKAASHTVYYIGLMPTDFIYAQDKIKNLADYVYFCENENELVDYLKLKIPLKNINSIIVIGSAAILRLIEKAKHTELKASLNPNAHWTASVYGPMQCMLKGVCAQCLQWQIDPKTGLRTKAVYACSWQHQPMEKVDINNLDERLGQNRAQEILTDLWVDYLLPA